jgi:hypothetical protein
MRTNKDSYFTTSDRPVKIRLCDHPACGQPGDHRAPKSRDQLKDYYFFCLDHVRDYNKAWDFFAGLSPEDVEAYTRNATVWERASWPIGQWGAKERKLRDQAMRDIFGSTPGPTPDEKPPTQPMGLAEREALTMLDLQPPVTFIAIKAQYRLLVKKYHPDLNNGDRDAEEKFKNINQSFATLRRIYEPVSEEA